MRINAGYKTLILAEREIISADTEGRQVTLPSTIIIHLKQTKNISPVSQELARDFVAAKNAFSLHYLDLFCTLPGHS